MSIQPSAPRKHYDEGMPVTVRDLHDRIVQAAACRTVARRSLPRKTSWWRSELTPPSLARRQRYLWLPLLLAAGIVSLLTGPLIDGAWLLMILIGAAAVIDTHTTTRRNQS